MVQRLITASFMVVFGVLVLYFGGTVFAVGAMLCFIVALREEYHALSVAGHRPIAWPTWVAMIICIPMAAILKRPVFSPILMVTCPDAIRGKSLLFVTQQGFVKQVPAAEFETANKLVVGTKLADGDLASVVRLITDPASDVVLCTGNDYVLRFPLAEIPEQKKGARGVRGMKLAAADTVTSAWLLNEDSTAEIRGRQIALNRLKAAHRDGKGTKARA